MSVTKLKYYHLHPTLRKTHLLETTPMPLLQQEEPFIVDNLLNEIKNNVRASLKKYKDKRFMVKGVAIYIGPDIHNKPSIQLSGSGFGECCALTIFPNTDFYDKVSIGDSVTVLSNYLVTSNLFGVVMKCSELIKVEKSNE